MTITLPTMIDNPSIKGREDQYQTLSLDLDKILASWRYSLFSFEWLTPDGVIREIEDLPESEQNKYRTVLDYYQQGRTLERPILGVGVMDNVEIGSRRDILLTLHTQGVCTLSVHIPNSAKDFFKDYVSS